jgi:hypothetical protein
VAIGAPFALSYYGYGGLVERASDLSSPSPATTAAAPAAPGRSTTLRPADDRRFADTARKLAAGEAAPEGARAQDSAQENGALQIAAVPMPVPRPPDIEEVNRAMAAFTAPAEGDDGASAGATKNESKDDVKSAAKQDSKVKHREASTRRTHRPAYRMTAQRDVAGYHWQDGRRFRFGRLDDDDRGAPPPFFW